MLDVAIVGAGPLGGAIAHLLATSAEVSNLRLVDEGGSLAAGTALDIMQAGPIQQFAARVSGSRDLTTIAGSDIIVFADSAGTAPWTEEDELTQVRRVLQLAPGRPIVCAATGHRSLVERVVTELGVPPARVLGSAPEALRGAIRAVAALEARVSPRDVSVMVLGAPPSHTVVPWEQAAIAGLAMTRSLPEPALRRLQTRVDLLWPIGPYALASGVLKVVRGLSGKTHEVTSCFVAAPELTGRHTRVAAWPVRLGIDGVTAVEPPPLSVHDRVALDNALALQKE